VQAGVDEIAHVPGWLVESMADAEWARLTEEDARLAAENGIVVVTTTVAGEAMSGTANAHAHGQKPDHMTPETGSVPHGAGVDFRALARDVQRANLTLLQPSRSQTGDRQRSCRHVVG